MMLRWMILDILDCPEKRAEISELYARVWDFCEREIARYSEQEIQEFLNMEWDGVEIPLSWVEEDDLPMHPAPAYVGDR